MRGKGRDQLVTKELIPEWQEKFPSPCGEKVGINVRNSMNHPSWWFAFPSPCGEMVGINGSSSLARSRQYIVSVPLRGNGRDQRFSLSLPKEEGYVFPSPCGEKVGINACHPHPNQNHPLHKGVSVPLRGKGRDQPYPRKSLNS